MDKMAANGGSTNEDNWSEPNTSSTEDVLAAISAFKREAGEIIAQTLQHFESTVRPWISQLVEEQIGLVKQEVPASMKENHAADASTAVVKEVKLQFRNRIAPQVVTGMPLLSENLTPIEIALVDAQTEEIVTTGVESTAKVEIMGFRVGDDDGSMTIGEFQERLMSNRKGKRVLQGNTFLQLKEGVGLLQSKISFTHSSKHTKNGAYRLGAMVVDAALRNGVEVAWSQTFVMKDGRSKYSEKHPYPLLLDEVCHLQHISYKGSRFKDMKAKGVITVKDLLTLFYTDRKRLEDILKLKAHSKFWNDIVENALASNGLFLYLDPSNQQKTGVVLNVKLQLTALVVEPHLYVQVNHLSDKQKVDSQNLVKFAAEHFKRLKAFEDETSLKKYLQSGIGYTSLPTSDQSLGTSNTLKEPTTPYSQVTYSSSGLTEQTKSMNNSNFHLGQSTNQTSERGKEKVPFDDETVYSKNHYQKYIASHLASLEGLTELNCGTVTAQKITDAGASSQDVHIFSQGQEEIEEFQSSGVTSQSERGKEKVPFEDETVYSKNYFQAYTSSKPTSLEGLNKLSFGTATAHSSIDAGTSSQAVDIFSDMEKLEEFQRLFSDDYDFHLASPNIECHSNPTIHKKQKYC